MEAIYSKKKIPEKGLHYIWKETGKNNAVQVRISAKPLYYFQIEVNYLEMITSKPTTHEEVYLDWDRLKF